MNMILVLVGGFIGASLRYLCSVYLSRFYHPGSLPWPILVINVLGSCLFGIVQSFSVSEKMSLLLLTGILGAFTTFSTFSLEAIQLAYQRKFSLMVGYILLSLGGSFIFFWLGYTIFSQ